MEKFLENLLTNLFKGIIYSVLFGIVGLGIGFLLGWPLLKGTYVTILIIGALVMIIAIAHLIGTPRSRMEFLIKGKIVDGHIEKFDNEEDKNKDFSNRGVSPAIISIVMITIGFLIEAMMH